MILRVPKGARMDLAAQENRVYLPEQTKNQSNFCVDLMLRLAEDIVEMEPAIDGVKGHYRMTQDIIRLRRELLRLSKMLDMTWR